MISVVCDREGQRDLTAAWKRQKITTCWWHIKGVITPGIVSFVQSTEEKFTVLHS